MSVTDLRDRVGTSTIHGVEESERGVKLCGDERKVYLMEKGGKDCRGSSRTIRRCGA